MQNDSFLTRLDDTVKKYDLLCHPFYKAWSAGSLTIEDLREYGNDYYHHVEAFPSYLAEFSIRLDDGQLRRAVLANLMDEKGANAGDPEASPSHADLWLDFVEGMGGHRPYGQTAPSKKVQDLISWFRYVAREGAPAEALATIYAYESQIPRIAGEKDRGLRDLYGANQRTRQYFTLHTTADVFHSQIWRKQLENQVKDTLEAAERALEAAETTARMLWQALDGIEEGRQQRRAA